MARTKNRRVARNATFGFSFLIEANGGGTGAAPKTYSITDPTDQDLLGFTDDNAAGVTLGWASDPGDSPDPALRVPPPSRQYDAGVSPNNIRLSQVSLSSLTATWGLRSVPQNPNLPASFNWARSTAGGVDPLAIVGDLSGIRRIRVTLQSPRLDPLLAGLPVQFGRILVNGGILLTQAFPSVEMDVTNLGLVGVVNLSTAFAEGTQTPIQAVVGVHIEADL